VPAPVAQVIAPLDLKIITMTINTVYIIGAGASKEANLPTGAELKSKIIDLLDLYFDYQQTKGDRIIGQALITYAKAQGDKNIKDYVESAWHIRDALPQALSIDNFIDAHKGNEKIALCGKLAIVRSILDAEANSMLKFNDNGRQDTINFGSLEKTWYMQFFRLITENCTKDDLKNRFQSITLIIFNYDRCIEHFLYYALQNYYRISNQEAADVIKSINIYHPYGDVGYLPWYNPAGAIQYGATPNVQKLLDYSSKIKTFTEGTDPNSSNILSLHQKMIEADRVVFLGFAFHKLNMQLISPSDKPKITPKREVKCFATTLNISDSDKYVIEGQIKQLFQDSSKVNMINKKCVDFFNEYWRSLSF
jgi:hypothetical protein